MKEYIEYAGRHNVYYKQALYVFVDDAGTITLNTNMDSYSRYKNMDKEMLLEELDKARERNKGLGTNISVADCRIIYKLLENKEEVCLKD